MTEASVQPVLPNDDAARSTTGEILEPAQIAAAAAAAAKPAETDTSTSSSSPDKTSTDSSTEPKPDATAKPDATTGAPETYAAFTAPEGQTLDQAILDKATPIFKEMGLTQEQAQKLVTLNAELSLAAAKAPREAYESTIAAKRAETLADPFIRDFTTKDGKSGIEGVKAEMGRALNALGDAKLANEFKDAMNITGVGDWAPFVKVFTKMAAFVTEGKHVAGANPSPNGQVPGGKVVPPTAAQALYPNLPSAAKSA